MSKRVVASAEVVVTLRISADGRWGPECSLDQIHKQAKEDVRNKLERMAEAVRGSDIKIVRWDDIETVSTESK
jgi:hypothetical protein